MTKMPCTLFHSVHIIRVSGQLTSRKTTLRTLIAIKSLLYNTLTSQSVNHNVHYHTEWYNINQWCNNHQGWNWVTCRSIYVHIIYMHIWIKWVTFLWVIWITGKLANSVHIKNGDHSFRARFVAFVSITLSQ